jgi:hypothetical protein
MADKAAADFSAEERKAIDALAAGARKKRTPSPVWAAYEQALLDRDFEIERLKSECGVTSAHEAEEAASEAVNSVKAYLLDTPAQTVAGLVFKARYAAREDNAYDEDVPPVGSSVHHTCVQLCHLRLAALYRITKGRAHPDDVSLTTGAESLLANRGWEPRDFGFDDPPEFTAVRMHIVEAARKLATAPIDCASPEATARAAWKIPAGKRVVY